MIFRGAASQYPALPVCPPVLQLSYKDDIHCASLRPCCTGFSGSQYEVSYAELVIQPLLYQNDVARLSTDLGSVQMGNTKMEAVAETQLLDYNLDKSCNVVIGINKAFVRTRKL